MKFGEKVVKFRKLILIVAVVLLIPSVLGMKATKINYDMLTYLPKDMDTVKGQDLLMDEFGKGGFTMVVVENMKTDDVKTLKKQIQAVPHVDSVLNLQQVINPAVPLKMYPSVVQKNIKNENASMLAVFFDTSTSAEPTIEAIHKIRAISSKNVYVSGLSALVTDLKAICEREEAKYVGIAVILSLIAMMLLLDSYAAPFLFLISIGMAILYNLGTNIMFGEISYVTKAIAAVLQLGVTTDYSIFLWHSYIENMDKGMDDYEGMAEAVNNTLTSVVGSSVTTIAGFLALCAMTYTMGRDLGLVMAKGVFFGVLTSVTILPAMLMAFRNILKKTRHRSLIPDMKKLAHGLTGRYGIYLAIFAILLIPAIIGYNKKVVIYDFTKMLSSSAGDLAASDTQFMTANQKLEKDFKIGTTELIIADASLDSVKARSMCDEIEDLPGVQNVLGMDALMGTAIPKDILPSELKSSLMGSKHQMIMVNSRYKVSTDECNDQIDQINKILNKYDKSAKLIGEAPATKDLIQLTARDFNVVSFLSILAVFFIIFFVLRSVTLPFLLVAAIEFAIYVNLGIPGYTGLELPFIVPVCISTIQLGSTVDYAILMSTRYKTERMSGKGKRDAIETAAAASIPSVIVSAVGFFTATFGVGVYSNIGIISTFCNLMARGALISMATVILVVPALFMAFDKLICRTTKGLRPKDLAAAGKGETVE